MPAAPQSGKIRGAQDGLRAAIEHVQKHELVAERRSTVSASTPNIEGYRKACLAYARGEGRKPLASNYNVPADKAAQIRSQIAGLPHHPQPR